MGKLKDIIFYRADIGPEEEQRHLRTLHFVYAIAAIVCLGICIGVVSLSLASPYLPSLGENARTGFKMFLSYFLVLRLVILNLLPVVLLILFLYFLSGRAWIAFPLTALSVLGLSAANYYKIKIRNDPFYFTDFQFVAEAGNVLSGYKLTLSPGIIAAVLLIILGTLFAVFMLRNPLKNIKVRAIGPPACAIIGAVCYTTVYTSDTVYAKAANNVGVNIWSEMQVYISKGFVYPFIHSAKDAFPAPPDGYSEEEAAAMLGEFPKYTIEEDEQINVISIMLEAYSDLSKFESIEFSRDVYEKLHRLQEESYHGNLVSNTFAGGTTNSERAFLTGYPDPGDYRGETNSYVWYLREQGYYTEGFHAGEGWFYNRQNVNAYLGLENYYFLEDFEDSDRTDAFFFPKITEMFNERDKDKPYFSYNLTFQNHGAYASETTGETEYISRDAGYSDASYNILNNYVEGIYDTNERIYDFIDQFRTVDEPVVIVLFGDHMPWLGDNNSVYAELQINTDLSTDEGFYNYYSVPYIIWANDAAKEVAGNDFKGEGGDISGCFLMQQLFELCGWGGSEYMQAASDAREHTEVIHTGRGLYDENGVSDKLSAEAQSEVDKLYRLEYYMKNNFMYQNLK